MASLSRGGLLCWCGCPSQTRVLSALHPISSSSHLQLRKSDSVYLQRALRSRITPEVAPWRTRKKLHNFPEDASSEQQPTASTFRNNSTSRELAPFRQSLDSCRVSTFHTLSMFHLYFYFRLQPTSRDLSASRHAPTSRYRSSPLCRSTF